MKVFAGVVLCLLLPVAGAAQTAPPPDDAIAARQAEVTQLGSMMYRVHLDDGTWTHEQIALCPAFKHHIFVRYSHQNSNGTGPSYLAVYPLDASPAKAPEKPWQSGTILVPLPAPHDGKTAVAERPGTMGLFNHVWADELRQTGDTSGTPQFTWGELGNCYARLANENITDVEPGAHSVPFDLRSENVHSILIPLDDKDGLTRAAYVVFNHHGFVVRAHITTEGKIRHITPAPIP